jgi:hypothetical protein
MINRRGRRVDQTPGLSVGWRMATLRDHRALIACLAILGLIFNLIVGVICCAPGNNVSSEDFAFAEPWTICSHDSSGAAPAADPSGPQRPIKPCPLCLMAGTPGLIATVTPAFAVVDAPASRSFAFDAVPATGDDLRRSGLGSRAPPLPA